MTSGRQTNTERLIIFETLALGEEEQQKIGTVTDVFHIHALTDKG